MCQGHGKFVDAKAMLVAAIELAKKQREPVIEVVMGLVLRGVDVRGKEPGERFKAAQAFNAPGAQPITIRVGCLGALCPP